jgi:hypothetical protein
MFVTTIGGNMTTLHRVLYSSIRIEAAHLLVKVVKYGRSVSVGERQATAWSKMIPEKITPEKN